MSALERKARLSFSQRVALAAPYAWMILFFIAPMALIAKISLSRPATTMTSKAISQPGKPAVASWAGCCSGDVGVTGCSRGAGAGSETTGPSISGTSIGGGGGAIRGAARLVASTI